MVQQRFTALPPHNHKKRAASPMTTETAESETPNPSEPVILDEKHNEQERLATLLRLEEDETRKVAARRLRAKISSGIRKVYEIRYGKKLGASKSSFGAKLKSWTERPILVMLSSR